jgi:hypothetical protein
MRDQEVAGGQLVGVPKGGPAGFLRAAGLLGELPVEFEPLVEVVEDPAHEAPAVKAVVEVVRARLGAVELQGVQDLKRREGLRTHGACLPWRVVSVKTGGDR